MATLTFYLLFDGNCRQAMEFYKSCFGGELALTRVGESSMKDYMPADTHHKVINAQLLSEGVTISASDWLRPDRTPVQGNTVCLYLVAVRSVNWVIFSINYQMEPLLLTL